MAHKTISDDTYISAFVPVSEWNGQRAGLIKGILKNRKESANWESAYKLMETRITTRFIKPIELILSTQWNSGEGFSAVALQCIFIEFLEALYQGKVYTTSKKPRDFEYNSSRKLFCDFLTGHKPFSDYFKNKDNAEGFFDNIRCGLLHEAATKESSRINNAPTHDMIVLFEKDDPRNMRIYRENFFDGIRQFIESYKAKLLVNNGLKTNFIRKMDDICGIKHSYYFAYGSNMNPTRLLDRIGKYHTGCAASLADYGFLYNKKSTDGTSKANLEKASGKFIRGVCYEIDEEDLNELDKYEKGYSRHNIEIKRGEACSHAVTYISKSVANNLLPSSEYREHITKGAEYWQLDKNYITEYL